MAAPVSSPFLRLPPELDPAATFARFVGQVRDRFTAQENAALIEETKKAVLRVTVPGYSAKLFFEALELQARQADLLGQADLAELLKSLKDDAAYRDRFIDGFMDGRWDGTFEAVQTRVDDVLELATTVMEVQRSINDPMLWVLGVAKFLTARGSPNNEAATRRLTARLESYEYFKKARKLVTELPKLATALLQALRNPEMTIAHLIVQLAEQATTEFRSTNNARDRGYMIGKLVGRAVAEALFIVLDIVGVPELVLGKIAMEVPEIADLVRRIAAKVRKIPVPTAIDDVVKESERVAARRGAHVLEAATPSPPVGGPLPKVPVELSPTTRLIERLREKFPLLKQRLTSDQLAEVLEYARNNRNRFSVKGILAEQFIPHNAKFEALKASIVSRLGPEWDPDTVQYVRRVVGVAPTETTAGEFADLADGFIIALAKDPNARTRVNILAVFEAKSPTNVRALSFGKDGDIGQLGWTLERISENPITLEVGTKTRGIETWTLDPDKGEFAYSPRRDAITAKRLVIPKDHQLSASEIERLKEIFPDFDPAEHVWRHTESNDELQQMADSIVDLMDAEHPRPKVTQKKAD